MFTSRLYEGDAAKLRHHGQVAESHWVPGKSPRNLKELRSWEAGLIWRSLIFVFLSLCAPSSGLYPESLFNSLSWWPECLSWEHFSKNRLLKNFKLHISIYCDYPSIYISWFHLALINITCLSFVIRFAYIIDSQIIKFSISYQWI